jgi:hypothetical protein
MEEKPEGAGLVSAEHNHDAALIFFLRSEVSNIKMSAVEPGRTPL